MIGAGFCAPASGFGKYKGPLVPQPPIKSPVVMTMRRTRMEVLYEQVAVAVAAQLGAP